jgi:two-component system, OmpR family, sensor kinase
MTTLARNGIAGSRTRHDAFAEYEAPPLGAADLLAVIGHELSTPLTTINAAMELIETAPGQRPNALTMTVRRQVTRLLTMFEASMRAAAILAGGRMDRDAAASVAELLERLRDGWPESEQKLRLSVECTADLPPVAIEGAAAEVIVNNLLMNAFKHSSGMHVTLTAEQYGDDVHVAIADDGRGIPAHLRPDLFELGQRGDSSRGSGLGLYVARELARSFGGDVWLAESSRGARFVVSLPISKAVAA